MLTLFCALIRAVPLCLSTVLLHRLHHWLKSYLPVSIFNVKLVFGQASANLEEGQLPPSPRAAPQAEGESICATPLFVAEIPRTTVQCYFVSYRSSGSY